MARLPRIGPAGIPQHVIQRGNNRQICFGADQDFAFYANCLEDYSVKHEVDIHAWVFMTNHVHLLVTPSIGLPVRICLTMLIDDSSKLNTLKGDVDN